jgi:hypothetical protein
MVAAHMDGACADGLGVLVPRERDGVGWTITEKVKQEKLRGCLAVFFAEIVCQKPNPSVICEIKFTGRREDRKIIVLSSCLPVFLFKFSAKMTHSR